ncbi:Uncharacterized protein Rs2_10423 [Raphanus sativus]|nr:Uncharacterized protein Rs2_10423 [Raphanus sativus]
MALSSSSLLAALHLFGRSLSPGSGCSAFCAEVGALQSRFVLVIRLSLGVTGRGATETGTGSEVHFSVVPPLQPVLLLGRCGVHPACAGIVVFSGSTLPPIYRFCAEEWSDRFFIAEETGLQLLRLEVQLGRLYSLLGSGSTGNVG